MGRLTAVVPTLGTSPLLEPCLEALREDGGDELSIVVVYQGTGDPPAAARIADQVVLAPRPRGFAPAVNRGFEAAETELVAPINDDLLVEAGWSAALTAALDHNPAAASAQGVNLRLDTPELTDGCGIGWNRWWQAVQLENGAPPPPPTASEAEIFGVSATAAVYRREALDAVRLPNGDILDTRLGSYYEDVDLACRLRARGWTARLQPAARALHAGSVTGDRRRAERMAHIHGNRLLVLARLFGGSFWRRVPAIVARDLKDLARATITFDGSRVAGVARGLLRAAALLPRFARRGPALVPAETLDRFRSAA